MVRIKEIIKKKEEESDEESGEEDIGDFVEAEIQNPDILKISDLALQSGQTLPEILIGDTDLERTVGVEKENDDDEKPQYEANIEDKLYEQKERRTRRSQQQREVASVSTLDVRRPIDEVGLKLGESTRDFDARDFQTFQPSWVAGMAGGDDEPYEVEKLGDKQEMPWEQEDERVKKYKGK